MLSANKAQASSRFEARRADTNSGSLHQRITSSPAVWNHFAIMIILNILLFDFSSQFEELSLFH